MSGPDMSAFAQYIPGFEFLQNLTRQAAASAAPGTQSSVPGMPSLSHWVAPTFDVEEIDKRIQDLRAVHFWLDQNTKALAATIQALEVQKMTLATLKSMNVSLHDMAEAFKMRPESTEPPLAKVAAPGPAEPKDKAKDSADDAQPASSPGVDPMQWWAALTQQFQTIATSAMQDMADHASRAAEQMAQSVQAGAEAVAAAQVPTAAPTDVTAPKPVPKQARKAATAKRTPSAAKTPAKSAKNSANKSASESASPARAQAKSKPKPGTAQPPRSKSTP